MIRIEAARLIPGRGEPIEHGCLVMADSKLTYAGPTASAPSTPHAKVIIGVWKAGVQVKGGSNAAE